MKQTSSLLINEPPLQLLPSLAKRVGLNQAIVIQQLHYWIGRSKNVRDNRRWVYNSYDEWQRESFPFWSISTIQRIFKGLEASKLILSAHDYNKMATDRTKWYAIDYDELDKLTSSIMSTWQDGNGQFDTMLPETTQETIQESARPNIFSVYESNIGPLTSHIGEALSESVTELTETWVADAIKLAAERNRRSWGYAKGILRGWKASGKDWPKPDPDGDERRKHDGGVPANYMENWHE